MKTYSQHEFNLLEVKDQVTLSSLIGTHLMTRKDGDYRIKLFFLGSYYVELWKDKHEVLFVRAFNDDKNLDVYLEKIDLSEIVKH
jgi:hypothetical protein